MDEKNQKLYDVMAKSLTMPDEHSFGVYKMLEDVYPAFARKIFQGNDFMRRLVMTGHNPMDILDYPICGRCETLAAWDGYGISYGKYVPKCTCFAEKCGASTKNPILFRDWIKMELKKKAPSDIVEVLELAVDDIAVSMLRKYAKELHDTKLQNGRPPDDSLILPEDNVSIEHCGTKPTDLEDFKEDV